MSFFTGKVMLSFGFRNIFSLTSSSYRDKKNRYAVMLTIFACIKEVPIGRKRCVYSKSECINFSIRQAHGIARAYPAITFSGYNVSNVVAWLPPSSH